jgi:hypothetical protein
MKDYTFHLFGYEMFNYILILIYKFHMTIM